MYIIKNVVATKNDVLIILDLCIMISKYSCVLIIDSGISKSTFKWKNMNANNNKIKGRATKVITPWACFAASLIFSSENLSTAKIIGRDNGVKNNVKKDEMILKIVKKNFLGQWIKEVNP